MKCNIQCFWPWTFAHIKDINLEHIGISSISFFTTVASPPCDSASLSNIFVILTLYPTIPKVSIAFSFLSVECNLISPQLSGLVIQWNCFGLLLPQWDAAQMKGLSLCYVVVYLHCFKIYSYEQTKCNLNYSIKRSFNSQMKSLFICLFNLNIQVKLQICIVIPYIYHHY